MELKTEFEAARLQKIESIVSGFANSLADTLSKHDPLGGTTIEIPLGDARKGEVRACNAFQAFKDACKQKNVRFSMVRYEMDSRLHLRVNPKKKYKEATNAFERLFMCQ